MVDIKDYGNYETAWCPGCGNFSILQSLKKALVHCGLEPHQVLLVSGIGQAAKEPHYLNANVFNGLHGRSLPAATGAKLANPELTVIDISGDGCQYGEGGNHFMAAIRRNINITVLVHDNQVYGLTKGQASPTTQELVKTKSQPEGVMSHQFNPILTAVAMDASFVARGFSGMPEHLEGLMVAAIKHKGFSLVDILQPCVSFNKLNTFSWYKDRCYVLDKTYDPANWTEAIKTSAMWGDKIPLGIIYKHDKETLDDRLTHHELGKKTDDTERQAKVKDIIDGMC